MLCLRAIAEDICPVSGLTAKRYGHMIYGSIWQIIDNAKNYSD
jgi:hypothetical protein